MMNEHFVEEPGVTLAWGRALETVARPGRKEIAPLTVSITGDDSKQILSEDARVRKELDRLLKANGKPSVDTVANTIFPDSLWNPSKPRQALFDRYQRIAPRIRQAARQNKHGIYFERIIANGPGDNENQLDFGLRTYSGRKGVRRSVLQVGVFDPGQDHSAAAMRGFPCLQHLSFVPDSQNCLSVNAFYAIQYMFSKAYGNYLGLCHLGRFVAHELGLNLTRVTCHVGLAELDAKKSDLRDILALIDATFEEHRRLNNNGL
ncbi:MAG: thymidylate synthase [Gammaproteobacteria bacterium]|nr:thymidylate synthase [Gammaproteobacteria bacterium]